MPRSPRSNHAGTCATSCSEILTGRAWRTVSRYECRLWILCCSSAWGRRLLPLIRQPSRTLPLVAPAFRLSSAAVPRPASPLPFGSGSQRAEEWVAPADCGVGRLGFIKNFERAVRPLLVRRQLGLQPECCGVQFAYRCSSPTHLGVSAVFHSSIATSWLRSMHAPQS